MRHIRGCLCGRQVGQSASGLLTRLLRALPLVVMTLLVHPVGAWGETPSASPDPNPSSSLPPYIAEIVKYFDIRLPRSTILKGYAYHPDGVREVRVRVKQGNDGGTIDEPSVLEYADKQGTRVVFTTWSKLEPGRHTFTYTVVTRKGKEFSCTQKVAYVRSDRGSQAVKCSDQVASLLFGRDWRNGPLADADSRTITVCLCDGESEASIPPQAVNSLRNIQFIYDPVQPESAVVVSVSRSQQEEFLEPRRGRLVLPGTPAIFDWSLAESKIRPAPGDEYTVMVARTVQDQRRVIPIKRLVFRRGP